MPDTVLGSAGQKRPLGCATGKAFLSDTPQIPLEDGLGNTTGDALRKQTKINLQSDI
jgi:hypothetical protein